jgi:uncharacterized protein (DUF1330 family)
MTKGYWVAMVDVTDPEGYKEYVAANRAALRTHGARFRTRGGSMEVHEGAVRARVVVVEFPSLQAAKDCYHSPEYVAAMAMRAGRSIMDLAIVEGYPGVQPTD